MRSKRRGPSPVRRRTRTFRLTGGSTDRAKIDQAAAVLRDGGLVAFPTETVYGLGANALSEEAVLGIFAAKGRPSDNPLIVHLASSGDLARVARALPRAGTRLAKRFWPGPLTLILPKHPAVPLATTAGLDTVAVRVPSHPVAHQLISRAGVPIAAPSANLSGRPSLTSPSHLLRELSGRVDVILLGGDSPIGLESTVVDVTTRPPRVLRPGGLTLERVRQVLPSVRAPPLRAGFQERDRLPARSPGLRHRHYAPRARLTLFIGPTPQVWEALERRRRELVRAGVSSALLVSSESPVRGRGVWVLGSRRRPSAVARRLFSAMRDADGHGVQEMLVEGIPMRGMGLAVRERLMRAAEGRVVLVPSSRKGPKVVRNGRSRGPNRAPRVPR